MPDPSDAELISSFLLDLYGGDPFASVYRASNEHREAHGPDCEVYPGAPVKMRFISTLVRATASRRILEIGCGLGYSALWLADAAGPEARVQTIDRFPEHAELARRSVAEGGLAERLEVLVGEGEQLLETLPGPYDLIHDDGWFAREPPYLERVVDLLRGGLLVMSNWFLLRHALVGDATMDWSQFAGPDWATDVQAYAEKLSRHPRLHISFVMEPAWLGLAVRTG